MADCHHVKQDIRHAPGVLPGWYDATMSRYKRTKTHREIQAEVGKRLLWARELVEPNRSQFSREVELDRSTVQKIEDGDRAPSIFNVIDFAHRLRVTADYLLFGSMRGLDSELAAALAARHPELGKVTPASAADSGDRASDSGTPRKPTKPGRTAA